MFVDEARFGRMNRIRPCWAPVGTRPEVAAQLIRVRDDGCALGAIDQTGTAQKRCEIIDLAMVVEDFIVQRREEFRETHLLFRRDLLERVLLTVGGLSDYVGRRPVILGGLLLNAIAMIL